MKKHLYLFEKIFKYAFEGCKIAFEPKSSVLNSDYIVIEFEYFIITWSQMQLLITACTENNLQFSICKNKILIKSK